MAAVGGSNGILCHLSYIGALNSRETTVTAIKITTKSREIIATLPHPGASLQQAHFSIKEQILKPQKKSHQEPTTKHLVLSKYDLLHMNVQLELTPKTAQQVTTTFLAVKKPPSPKLRGSKKVFITVHYPKEQSEPYITFTPSKKQEDTENAPAPIAEDFLKHLAVLTEDLSSNASFNREEPHFCLLMTTLDQLKTIIGEKMGSSEVKNSEKTQADLLPKTFQELADIEPPDDLQGGSATIKALLSQAKALIATLQQDTAVDLRKSTLEKIKKKLKIFDNTVCKAHQRALTNTLIEKHCAAAQQLADADNAYTQASASEDQSAISAAVKQCCNQIAHFNKVANELRDHNIKTKTLRYTHLSVSSDTGLAAFKNSFLAMVLSS